MGLYNVMITSTSGMAAQTNWLGTISDNIANAKTTGYKNADTEFSTLVVNGGVGEYNSGGVSNHTRYDITRQGVLNYTSSSTDISIQGNGFFVVSDKAGNTYLTRAGSFVPAVDGTLVNAAGYKLMGYPVTGGVAGPNLTDIDTSSLALQAELSTAGSLTMNLPAAATVPQDLDTNTLPSANPGSDANPVTPYYTKKTSLTAYGDLGKAVMLDIYATKIDTGTWEITIYDHDQATNGGFPYKTAAGDPATPLVTTNGNESIVFNPTTGAIESGPRSLSIPISATANPVILDLSMTTQLAAPFSVINTTMNGHEASAFDRLSIDASGNVAAVYANGVEQAVFQIPLANVSSPNNLSVLSGNIFQANANSGNVFYGTAETSGFGKVISGALEGSTADIATELTKLIVAQRNFTANSSVFKTGSELMDVLNNLVR